MKVDYENAAADVFAHGTCADDGHSNVVIVVCSSCRDETGSDARPRAGEQLAIDTRRAADATSIQVETVECLGNCKRRLSAAIAKDGAWSYDESTTLRMQEIPGDFAHTDRNRLERVV